MAKAKKQTKGDFKEELEQLLFAGAGNLDTEGLLTFAKRTLTGDLPQRKIARVREILNQL